MPIDQFIKELDDLATSATEAFAAAADESQLDAARVEFLGAKNGRLKSASKNMGAVAGPDKKQAGQKLNAVKSSIEESFVAAQSRMESGLVSDKPDNKFDPTLPGRSIRIGRTRPTPAGMTCGAVHPAGRPTRNRGDFSRRGRQPSRC